ncbi:MAG: T9SS type A sorting domain-containing protein [candidate division WOR-3 bacterium]
MWEKLPILKSKTSLTLILILLFCGLNIIYADETKKSFTDRQNLPFDANEIIKRVTEKRISLLNSDNRYISSDYLRKRIILRGNRSLLNETKRSVKSSQPKDVITKNSFDEFLIDTSVVYMPACNLQEMPVIGFDGTNYLIVWSDWRIGQYSDIYGARVTTNGTILDPAGIIISSADKWQFHPSVAFDGTNYLVVWQDYRSNAEFDIYGARVSKSGIVLDPNGIAISIATGDQWYPRAAYDGSNYLVVWQDYRNGGSYDIYGARVNPVGTVLDPTGIEITTADNDQRSPSLAFDGVNYLVVWEDDRNGVSDIYGTRVSQSGVVLDPSGIAISTASNNQWLPKVAFDNTNYFVVWEDYRSGIGSDIYGTRVTTAGVVLDASGIPISTATNDQFYPEIVSGGSNYLVVWTDYRSGSYFDIYGARVSSAGVVLDASGILMSATGFDQYPPSVSFDGTNYFVIWQDNRNSPHYSDIYGTRVSQSGVVLNSQGIAISTAGNDQWTPSAAFDGTNFFIVWEDKRNGINSDIYGARITQTGIILNPAGIPINTVVKWQGRPAVAYDGTNYLVVWVDERNGVADIYGARVSQSGFVLDPNGFAISTAVNCQGEPAIAFDGTNYLVVWEDFRNNPDTSDIYGARVGKNGTVLDPTGIPISTAPKSQWSPKVAFDGTNYFVVWEDDRGDYSDIYGARVNPNGNVLEPDGIIISSAQFWQSSPAIAFNGTEYLVAWQDWRTGVSDVFGTRVDTSGNVLDPDGFQISSSHTVIENLPIAVIFNGTNYIVVWTDERNSTSWDLYGAEVNTSGEVVDSFPVSVQNGDQFAPTFARGLRNQLLLSYTGWTENYQTKKFNTYRTWGKFFGFVLTQATWARRESLPTKVPTKKIKDGGAIVGTDSFVFAFRGNKSNEFYKYIVSADTWILCESLPYGRKPDNPDKINKRQIGKGAKLCWNGDSLIYATRGKGTFEFWQYNILRNTWTPKKFVPTVKGLKGGTSLVYKDGKVYLLAGGQKAGTNNFFVYDCATDNWTSLTSPPLSPDNKVFKDGSCLAVMGNTIYALKGGAKFNYFLAYNINNGTWNHKETIPQKHPMIGKKTKVKDGGGMVNVFNSLYVIKGGGYRDFWKYIPGTPGRWQAMETIPRQHKKSVPKTGGCLAFACDSIYLIKGNNTREFWRYGPVIGKEKEDIEQIPPISQTAITANEQPVVNQFKFDVIPNPVKSIFNIYFTTPSPEKISIKLYDASGRLIQKLVDEFLTAGSYSKKISVKNLAKGIYFIRYSDTTNQKEIKLIVN